ncbi:Nodulation receptor kinase [Glycine soja]
MHESTGPCQMLHAYNSKHVGSLLFQCNEISREKLLVLLLFVFINLHLASSQTSVYNCVLNIQFSSSLINSNCELYHWGGFTNGCCGPYFDDYLYDLGPKANQTGKIFLNSSEQKNCIASMEAFNKKFTCYGIEKITSGVGGCSDYTITDVISKIGDNFRRLNEDCMPLSRNGRPNETCTKCLKTWEDIIAKSDSTRESESANASDYLCRFAVLVSLTSTRIYDRESIQEVYKCLREYSHSSVNQEVKVKASANANINSRKVYKGVLSNNQSVAVKHVTNEGNGKVLSWIQRLEIAIDSARGLEFLHTYPNGCIVHRDIKVMDLGQSYVSSEVRGTFGYIDPEYRTNHQVKASGDVYSFGIVLLQLLSGQRVLNIDFQRPMSLEFADPKLKGEYSVETFDIVLKLALSCIGLKRQRPSIEQVLYSLEKALDISL